MTIGAFRSLRNLQRFWVRDPDDEVGKAKDWLLDCAQWTVRYLILKRGIWPGSASVFIASCELGTIDEFVSVIYPGITFESLAIRTRTALQKEPALEQTNPEKIPFFGAGRTAGKCSIVSEPRLPYGSPLSRPRSLCSFNTFLTYRFRTQDAQMGYLSDVVAEDRNWAVLFLVISIGGKFGWKRFLVPPFWVQEANCHDSIFHLNVGMNLISDAPPFRQSRLVSHEYQQELLQMYYSNAG